MKELTQAEAQDKMELVYIEMPSGFHIAIDSTYLDQVEDFKIVLPTGEVLDTNKLEEEPTNGMTEQQMHDTIVVHVSRTWERIRLEQPFQEMPDDNIASVDTILEISYTILKDKVIQDFLVRQSGDVWLETDEGMSDIYIETLAEKIIKENYL